MLGHERGAGAQALHQGNIWEKSNRRARGQKEEHKRKEKAIKTHQHKFYMKKKVRMGVRSTGLQKGFLDRE